MVFEVPVGLRLGTFWWDEVDYIILDYPAQTRLESAGTYTASYL